MSNDLNSFADKVFRINPALDFTADTAFVAVKIPIITGQTIYDQVVVVTSNRELISWNEDSQFGDGIIASCGCPGLLEPRWSSQSVRAFQHGAVQPDSALIHREIRQYLQQYLGFKHPAEYDLVALWIMGTYLKPLCKCYPILFFNAPYESGKSRCLETISQLAFNGKWFGEISPAAFRRYSVEIKPTFCLDELQDIGLRNDSAMISLLLNAYNSSEAMLAGTGRHNSWRPELFKVSSAVAIGNAQEIKNQALQSRTIHIRTEYDPRFKNIDLPGVDQPEPSRIRDGLYGWFLSNWQSVRECYRTYPQVTALSAREMNSYKPLLSIAVSAGPEVAEAITEYAIAVKEQKTMIKKAMDDRFDLLLFLKTELEARGLVDGLPVISNKELADAYGRKNSLRQNYKRFLEMVNSLQVVSEIKNRSGSKYYVFNRAEIDKQLQLCEAKS